MQCLSNSAKPNANQSALLKAALDAAKESEVSGVYVTWSPHPSCILTSAASDEVRQNTGQCCRIASTCSCLCGHSLSEHCSVKPTNSYMKPPKCTKGCSCFGFRYCPNYPEETGQWWLMQRKQFSLVDWRKRVRQVPHDYVCVGCEQKVSDHETVFETKVSRDRRGAVTGEEYFPTLPIAITSSSSSSNSSRPKASSQISNT